ncbi:MULTISPECIES: PTS mannitol transporter subunit IICBA [Lacticaseibacillus]|uniref:PTS system mannitol-specific EIICB component n=1 Tax=Lacticaseibacillus casei DSM 20011 = JCM 1134 = ATCC 393 TaxID=1423732 RepID=A0AAD1ARS4_LACCA|nr:PTS mannitol transporter subunit IICBA [Lacticaseibacillus casei]MBI6597971.1 PTS mannitol transporter subunit IICBA [Lacticaseibacillus casei]MBO1481690.1 PTS mannitol transporter subunit IICBA [Lacticaseibacillus casei]MBO2416956.1 PTS mannitol transporter subunit IICBA [Lacticaseibacillus casei]MCK2081336.1 PTS mannitol transporter subunit IICBA [Lacticaseibacillus casei]MDZ5496092.1 PTS mannitol transporter subunit IICBA [Lacticaseibacillus casei]
MEAKSANTPVTEKKKFNLKAGMQSFGTKLSGMVLPNIGAFIAWGLITTIFVKGGWWANPQLAKMISPMVTYLLPLLIAYSGGSMVHGHRGGVVGMIATMGVIVGTNVPMFIGAMVMGPLAGWCIKKWDDRVQDKIRQGFEMLVNNFSAGIIGMLLAIVGFLLIGPIISGLTNVMAAGVDWIISHGLIWLANIFIEPAKILFLNNAINQGILTPLGIQAAAAHGKSILFLLEPDPGPGLGVLLAFALFGKGTAKGSAPSAIIIHFFGGIHEIYFPYVLMKPALFLSVMAGGVTGTTLFSIFNVGLKSSPSPGSIISLFAMSPVNIWNYLGLLIGVAGATTVSFLISAVILRRDKSTTGDELAESEAKMKSMKAEAKGQNVEAAKDVMNQAKGIKQIIFACDAGMGSSAMGASILRDKVKKAGLDLSVTNTAISNLQDKPGLLVVTQDELADRAKKQTPGAAHVAVENFLNSPKYDEIIASLKAEAVGGTDETATAEAPKAQQETPEDELNEIDFDKITEVDFLHHDQNIGSATMAQATFRSELRKLNKDVKVRNVAIGEIEDKDNVLIIASKETARRVKLQFANVQVYTVDGLLNATNYDKLIDKMK